MKQIPKFLVLAIIAALTTACEKARFEGYVEGTVLKAPDLKVFPRVILVRVDGMKNPLSVELADRPAQVVGVFVGNMPLSQQSPTGLGTLLKEGSRVRIPTKIYGSANTYVGSHQIFNMNGVGMIPAATVTILQL